MYMKKKVEKVEIRILDAYGNLSRQKGVKMPNVKLIIDNPYYQKRVKIIERRPDA